MIGALQGQKRALDRLELELYRIVNQCVSAESRSSAKATGTLNN